MNCSFLQERLSQYYDGELPRDLEPETNDHLKGCTACRKVLTQFQQLSTLSSQLATPAPPSGQWAAIEVALNSQESPATVPVRRWTQIWQRPNSALVAAAAIVLVVMSVGLIFYGVVPFWRSHHGSEMAVNFGRYLNDFQRDPQKAQQFLLTSYEGQAVELVEAARQVGYEPLAGTNLPPGYKIEKIYVLKMPCCTCAQVVCSRQDGRVVTIFEHDQDQPIWYGDRPSIDACCCGRPTKMVQVDDMLAVTWKSGERHLTVVGARDMEEVTQFVTHLGGDERQG